ncbi:uncharacterized protein LOC113497449 [Trichoplusia ni]|uniref:Uncharacterized protein LOC113497449 n=1 Tax=Trichoplusia ni TaxID=7111 RepID=A0A7E5VWU7_TRINI|nr:uncharacterized protein LOC113497449 [Trichoplusia ni]
MEVLLAYQMEVLENLKKAEKNYKKTPKERIKKPYLETRLDNLEQLWTVFKDGHKSIIGKVTLKDKQHSYFTEDIYEEFEELYVSYKTLLKEALQPYVASTSETSSVTPKLSAEQTSESDKPVSTPISTNFSSRGLEPSQVLLATVSVWAYNEYGYKQQLRGLLDQGSQASFVSESVVQLLGLSRKHVSGSVSGIGGGSHTNVKHMVSLRVVSRHNPEVSIQVNAYVLRSVTSLLPSTELHSPDWLHLDKIPLADPGYATPSKIDILLGAEVYSEILLDGIVRHNKILAQNTTLGWVLSGRVSKNSTSADNGIITMHLHLSGEELLRKFWEMENEPNLIQKKMTDTEKQCEEFYDKTTTRDKEGRFIVKLPFDKEDPECQYGKSVIIATRRYEYLERKLQQDPTLKETYNNVLQEYLTMNHMTPIKKEDVDNPKAVYLPHHAVVRQDKDTSKVRVVFDGSCKGLNNFSLNDNLMVGPKLQQDLRHILMRWRSHRICIVADIVKMFRMVKVNSEDTDFQRIVWRPQANEPLQHFKLLRVTFGTACAPYLAVKTLQRLADEEHARFPTASSITKRDFYIDDLLTGCIVGCGPTVRPIRMDCARDHQGKNIYPKAVEVEA